MPPQKFLDSSAISPDNNVRDHSRKRPRDSIQSAFIENNAEETAKETSDQTLSDVIHILLHELSGNELAFKIKRTTLMDTVMEAYAARKNIPAASFRLIFNGIRVLPGCSAEFLDMKDGDILTVEKIEKLSVHL